MKPSRLLTLCFLGILCLASAAAQTPQSPVERGPDNGPRIIIPGIEVPPFPNLPFSALDHITWTRTSEAGATTTLYITSKVVRDGQGRLYREHHRFAMADGDPAKTMYEFSILDPATHTRTNCELAAHLCTITDYHPHLTPTLLPVGPFDNNRRYLARASLGDQTLDDLPVTGTLETTTITPGTIGNDREVVTSREFWYSADLKTNLSVTRKDPHNGTQAMHLTIESRSEPDPVVFAIPSGYTVKDIRMNPTADPK